MIQPLRLQIKRTKGFRLVSPNNLPIVMVTRPGVFGNPFFSGMDPFRAMRILDGNHLAGSYAVDFDGLLSVSKAIECYTRLIESHPPFKQKIQTDLRGKNLACYCKLCEKHKDGKPFDVDCPDCEPCHSDILGKIAGGLT